MIRKLGLFVLLSVFIFVAGCVDQTDNTIAENDIGKLTAAAENVAERVINFCFENNYDTPGSALEYSSLWDNDNGTFNTFVTDYGAADEDILCVYAKASEISDLKEVLKDRINAGDDCKSFTDADNENVIDGKYLFAFSVAKTKQSKPKCYTAKRGVKIPFTTGDMQLVFCCFSKSAIIKSNVSNAENINKTIKVYSRALYKLDKDGKAAQEYNLENEDYASSLFDYEGEALEVFYPIYAERAYVYSPIFGLDKNIRSVRAQLRVYNGEKYVRLPRYELSVDGKVDLLDENIDFVGLDDVYKTQKNAFKAAEKIKADSDGVYEYALFDYTSVANIIKIAKK